MGRKKKKKKKKKKKEFHCVTCNVQFKKESEYRVHLKKHRKEKRKNVRMKKRSKIVMDPVREIRELFDDEGKLIFSSNTWVSNKLTPLEYFKQVCESEDFLNYHRNKIVVVMNLALVGDSVLELFFRSFCFRFLRNATANVITRIGEVTRVVTNDCLSEFYDKSNTKCQFTKVQGNRKAKADLVEAVLGYLHLTKKSPEDEEKMKDITRGILFNATSKLVSESDRHNRKEKSRSNVVPPPPPLNTLVAKPPSGEVFDVANHQNNRVQNQPIVIDDEDEDEDEVILIDDEEYDEKTTEEKEEIRPTDDDDKKSEKGKEDDRIIGKKRKRGEGEYGLEGEKSEIEEVVEIIPPNKKRKQD